MKAMKGIRFAVLRAVPGGRSSTSTPARRGKASQEVTFLGHLAQSWNSHGPNTPLGGSTGRAFEKGPPRPSIVPGREKRLGSHYRRPGVKSRKHRTKVSLPCESFGRGTGPARPGLLRKDTVRERASRVLVPYPRARHRRFSPRPPPCTPSPEAGRRRARRPGEGKPRKR